MKTYSETLGWRFRMRDFVRHYGTYRHWYGRLFREYPNPAKLTVLEVGCSRGYFVYYLLKNGVGLVEAVDSDHAALKILEDAFREHWPEFLERVKLECADACAFLSGVPGERYDFIFLNAVIEHFKKEDAERLLGLVRRALKPGGKVVMMTGNMENPLNVGMFARDYTHEVMYSEQALKQLLLKCGYGAVRVWAGTSRFLIARVHSFLAGLFIRAVFRFFWYRIDRTDKLLIAAGSKAGSQDAA